MPGLSRGANNILYAERLCWFRDKFCQDLMERSSRKCKVLHREYEAESSPTDVAGCYLPICAGNDPVWDRLQEVFLWNVFKSK